jgi:XTP/dITP diphosphohydrolase
MKIVFASGNKHKIEEFGAILKKYMADVEVISMKEAGIFDDIVEDGETFEDNAFIKASAVADLGYIGVADDSGLCVDALDGEPGVYSARYSGEPCDDHRNNELLLSKMKDVAEDKRTARFVSTIAAVFPDGRKFVARGECPGKILFEYRGNGGFGYDPLFLYEPLNKTFAEVNAEEKNAISHRARAAAAFAERFIEELIK